MPTLAVAVTQPVISADVRENGETVRAAMRTAAGDGARLVVFPEGMLSGYAKAQVPRGAEVDWEVLRDELAGTLAVAAELGIWVVLGSAHRLTPPNRPHNSLYVISDRGEIVDRYDKRFCSFAEAGDFYTPGHHPVVVEVDGYRFGCVVCVEINFPELFIEYAALGVDGILLPSYPVDEIFFIKARAYAAIHNLWVAVTVPDQCAHLMRSSVIAPDGATVVEVRSGSPAVTVLDREAAELDVPINRARPWRAAAARPGYYSRQGESDPRSRQRTIL